MPETLDAFGAPSRQHMDAIVSESMTGTAAQANLLGVFSLIAILLASIGIYGVLASAVNERRNEIGIRIAIGATPKDLLSIVFSKVLTLFGIGAVIGVFGSLLVAQSLKAFLFEVAPHDPWVLALVTAVIGSVALIAAYLPARRAANVQPLSALRHE